MIERYCASDYRSWAEAGLKDFRDFSDCVEYVNQSEYGDGQLEGEWFYYEDRSKTIYHGTFGNYNSPGSSCHTYALVYSSREEYTKEKTRLLSMPEYV